MYFLFLILGMTLGAPQDNSHDMYYNLLNISLGINYKYNGLLYHNIDRVWVVTSDPSVMGCKWEGGLIFQFGTIWQEIDA